MASVIIDPVLRISSSGIRKAGACLVFDIVDNSKGMRRRRCGLHKRYK